jgi:hypothetical protein
MQYRELTLNYVFDLICVHADGIVVGVTGKQIECNMF